MAARKEVIKTTLWLTRREREDDDTIAPNDWRDPSQYVLTQGARMVSGDTAWRGHEAGTAVEPDWSKGCWLEAPDHQQTHLIEFGGDPGEPFRSALLNGLVGVGVICFEDQQRHG